MIGKYQWIGIAVFVLVTKAVELEVVPQGADSALEIVIESGRLHLVKQLSWLID